jgi:hypothetical protein
MRPRLTGKNKGEPADRDPDVLAARQPTKGRDATGRQTNIQRSQQAQL